MSLAKETILLKSNAIANLTKLIDSNFENAVNFIENAKGLAIATVTPRNYQLTQIVASNTNQKQVGVVHLQNLIKEETF